MESNPSGSLHTLDAASGMPQRALISQRAEVVDALDLLLSNAHSEVLCMQRDLEVLQFSSARLMNTLEKFLLSNRTTPQCRVQLLVDEPRWLETQAHRLRQLHRHFNHVLEFRAAHSSDAVAEDSIVIVDRRHVMDLKVGLAVKGDVWLNHPLRAQPWAQTFERRWQHAGHNLSVSPLGL